MKPLLLPAKGLWAGFTGTRQGLTPKQSDGLLDLLVLLDPREVQHGDCVGADEHVHHLALSLGIAVAIRPPTDHGYRAWCSGVTYPEKSYLERNHDIVDHTNYLIGCPNTMTPVVRSGTWATIRYASKHGKVVFLVFPDGRLDRIEPDG